MNMFMLYRPNSEHERQALDYSKEFTHRTGSELELISIDTEVGAKKAELYDIVRYPAIVATREDGQIVQLWQEEMLPTINEVSGYLHQ